MPSATCRAENQEPATEKPSLPIRHRPRDPADHLIYLTDVAGVLDGEKVLSAISCEEIDQLIQSRVVSGGMILKLEAAKRALQSGVREVHIVGGGSAAAALAPSRFVPAPAKTTSIELPGTRVFREFSSAGHSSSAAV